MKELEWIYCYGRSCLLSMGFLITVLSACSSDKSSQSAQQENTPQKSVQPKAEPEEEAQPDTTQANQDMQAQTPPAQNRAAQNQDLASVGLKPRSNPVLKSLSVKYKDWDSNNDNILDFKEFYAGLYKVWDENKDNKVDQKEFQRATKNFFADYNFKEYGNFNDWDTDGNGQVSAQEFRNNMNKITGSKNKPIAERLFVVWDQDNDDAIEKIQLDNITVVLGNNNN